MKPFEPPDTRDSNDGAAGSLMPCWRLPSSRAAADQQNGLVVELSAGLPWSGKQALGDVGQWPIGHRSQGGLDPLESQLAILGIEHFDESVCQQSEDIPGQTVDRCDVNAAPPGDQRLLELRIEV
jgi:hypothetical protein